MSLRSMFACIYNPFRDQCNFLKNQDNLFLKHLNLFVNKSNNVWFSLSYLELLFIQPLSELCNIFFLFSPFSLMAFAWLFNSHLNLSMDQKCCIDNLKMIIFHPHSILQEQCAACSDNLKMIICQ